MIEEIGLDEEDLEETLSDVLNEKEQTVLRGAVRGAAKRTALKSGAKIAAKTGSKAIPFVGEAMMVADAAPVFVHSTKRQIKEAKKSAGAVGEAIRGKKFGKAAKETIKGLGKQWLAGVKGSTEVGTAALTSKEVAEMMYSDEEKKALAKKRAERKAKKNRSADPISFREYVEFRTGPRRYMVEMMADIIRMRRKTLERVAQSDHPMSWMASHELKYREAKNNPASWGTGRSHMSQQQLEQNIENILARFPALPIEQIVRLTHEERIDVLAALQSMISRNEITSFNRDGRINYRLVRRMVANPEFDYETIIPF